MTPVDQLSGIFLESVCHGEFKNVYLRSCPISSFFILRFGIWWHRYIFFLKSGYDADFVIWDPLASFKIKTENILHKNKLTPYVGQELFGLIHSTIVGGKIVWNNGTISYPAKGQLLLWWNTYLITFSNHCAINKNMFDCSLCQKFFVTIFVIN